MERFFSYFLPILLFVLLFFSGCTQTNSSKYNLEDLKKDALEVNPTQNQQNDSLKQNGSLIDSKYQQLYPSNSEEEPNLNNITINFTNNSEYEDEEKNNFEIKPFEIIPSGFITLDLKNGKKYSPECKIEVVPIAIKNGEEATVVIYANSFDQNVYYSCSDKIKFAGRSGIFRKESICKFDSPGLIKQSLLFDDKECAYSMLYVANKTLDDFYCAIFEQNKTQDLFGYNYFAKLFVYNFNSSDNIVLICGNKTIEKNIGEEILTTHFGFFDIGCYNLTSSQSIKINVGDKICKFLD